MSRRRLVGLLEQEPFLFLLGSQTTHFRSRFFFYNGSSPRKPNKQRLVEDVSITSSGVHPKE